MNVKIILSVIFFLLLINSVSALDISSCHKILDDNNNKRIWFGQVSYEDKEVFSDCVIEVAIEKNDPSICKKEYEKFKGQKTGEDTGFNTEVCQHRIMLEKENIDYCYNTYRDNRCFEFFAKKLNDKSICDDAPGYDGANSCLKNIELSEKRKANSPSFCLKYSGADKRQCIYYFATTKLMINACELHTDPVLQKRCVAEYALALTSKIGEDSICQNKNYFGYIIFPEEQPGGSRKIYDGSSYQKKCFNAAKLAADPVQCSKEMYIPNVDTAELFSIIKNYPQNIRDKCIPHLHNVENALELCHEVNNKLVCIKRHSPQPPVFSFLGYTGLIFQWSNNLINMFTWSLLLLAIFIIYIYSRNSTNEDIVNVVFCLFISGITMILLTIINFIVYSLKEGIIIYLYPVAFSLNGLLFYPIAHIISNLTIARIISGIIFVLINTILAYVISTKYLLGSNPKKIAILTIIIFNVIITLILAFLFLIYIGSALA